MYNEEDDDETLNQEVDGVDDDDDTPAIETPGHQHNGQLQFAVHVPTGQLQNTARNDGPMD